MAQVQQIYAQLFTHIDVATSVTEISYHIWSGDHTRTFYTPHR
jgi:hypothetical protein